MPTAMRSPSVTASIHMATVCSSNKRLPDAAFGGTMLGLKPGNRGIVMDRISDRDRAHLRGPVKIVVDGLHLTEYDRQGNILCWQINNPDGSQYGDSYTYEDDRVTSIVSRKWDGSTVQKHY